MPKNEKVIKTGMADDRQAAFVKATEDINKRYGDGAIMALGANKHMQVEVIPTGSLSVDLALGVGGVPRGRIVEIYGPESSGKTTLCLQIIAEAQKMGGWCAFVDMEHALDPDYAEKLGVNLETLFVSQPDTGEQALEICEALVRSGGADVVVVDSVAALVPQSELEGDMGQASMGVQARLMSQALRKLSGAIGCTKTTVLFTNQLRMKIGVMFGNPETTSGGMALKFYASQRIDIRRIQSLKRGEEVIGGRTRVRVVKNKVAPPFKTAEFDILFGEGISKVGEIIDLGVQFGVVTKRGAFLSYGESKLGQGKDKAMTFLKENPAMADEIERKIHAAVDGGGALSEESLDYPEAVTEEV